MITTYKFDKVSRSGIWTGTCRVCGKHGKRTATFSQTRSRFNRNPDGTIKTVAQITHQLNVLVERYSRQPFVHKKCEEQLDG